MCTIVLGVRTDPDFPWIVSANRDERLDRPSSPPRVIETPTGRILTPRDDMYGGTWIGVNDRGVLVALTNRDDPGEQHGARSRGLLVLDALACASAHDAAALVERTAEQYKHFHLVAADPTHACVVVHGREPTVHEALATGWHVITEQGYGAGADRRGEWLRTFYPRACFPPVAFSADGVARLLGTHLEGDPFDSPCVHTTHEGHDYGTRSFLHATFDVWDDEPVVRWWSHEGPTCTLDPRTLGYGTMFGQDQRLETSEEAAR